MHEAVIPTLDDLQRAAALIGPHIHRTPVMTSRSLDRLTGAELFFKCENLQKVGAFKARGASNAVLSLPAAAAAAGVATHSSGNHAAALARAAAIRGVPAFIVMPRTSPQVKVAAVAGYGAQITLCEPTLAAREAGLEEVVQRTGARFIPPYNDALIIAGQGTAALELRQQVDGLDVVVAPIGGGGLLSGTAIAAAASPALRVLGAEPRGADDAARSLARGRIVPSVNPRTIADGLLTSLGPLTFATLRAFQVQILTVAEQTIIAAMRLIWERLKLVVEPSGAVPLALVLEHGAELTGCRVGLILSGGNLDLGNLPWVSDDRGTASRSLDERRQSAEDR